MLDRRRIRASATGARLTERLRGERGQCSHCRRVRRVDAPSHWELVPQFVHEIPPATSHGLCRLCRDFYYPDSQTETDA